jgi:lipocalin
LTCFPQLLAQGVPVAAPYTVALLGPSNMQNQGLYDYAVVSDPFNFSLFVLARDPVQFRAEYDSFVTQWLTQKGFTNFLNTPTPTYQGSNCLYPSTE